MSPRPRPVARSRTSSTRLQHSAASCNIARRVATKCGELQRVTVSHYGLGEQTVMPVWTRERACAQGRSVTVVRVGVGPSERPRIEMVSVASSRNELWSSMFDAIICGKYEYATCNMQHATATSTMQHVAVTMQSAAQRNRAAARDCGHAVTYGMASARERRITHLAVLAEGPRLNLSGTTMDNRHATTPHNMRQHHTQHAKTTTRNTRQQPHRATRDS